MIVLMAITCMVIAVMLRPKDKGVGVKTLQLQFFLFAIRSEGANIISQFQGGFYLFESITLRRMIIWPIIYGLWLKLRRKAAQLSLAKLSN